MRYLKRLDIDNIKNARDLGGVPTLDHRSTKWHEFFRTASLDDINDADMEQLKKLNVSTIIDLRRINEIDFESESHKKIKENFDYHHISLAPDREFRKEEIEKIISGKISVGQSYRNLIDHYVAVKEIVEVLARAEGSVLYHCQEGKDRTGIVSMIIMGLADVARGDIIADYEISSAHLGYIERYDEDEPFSVFRITDPYYMKEAYDYVIRKYGSFEAYLLYAKCEQKDIYMLRSRIRE
ncbi:Tyrosine-protein phosphatase family protein [Anaerococcus lactolyticus ATCC 51172]|uniref:Tyrosine-protein phosphatase family protein n=1 Tax=Anaerococcus lactolyticus ATCC 51172 TaxID=525254 RepID=C2BCJ6_9FIRM|nr:tyrosine-protein phosphatase [Anaerococcus lactolyticus]EEI87398.1 Tyrosine-protein phosphatase family protein [Anaerococcus lactolyticus ATCC 51172]